MLQEYHLQETEEPTSTGCMGLRRLLKRRQSRRAKWKKGDTLQAHALQGTSLAAATWGDNSIRLYYQDQGLELREHCCDHPQNGWYVGK